MEHVNGKSYEINMVGPNIRNGRLLLLSRPITAMIARVYDGYTKI